MVGAPGALVSSVNAGEAYLYDLENGSRVATIPNPTPLAFADFGHSVAVSGDRVLIGAPGSVILGVNPAAAYVYDSETGLPAGTIPDPDPLFAGFGAAVALRGDAALIGDVSTPLFGFNDGTAHLFDVSDGHLVRTLVPDPAPGGDGFGFSVAAARRSDRCRRAGSGARSTFTKACAWRTRVRSVAWRISSSSASRTTDSMVSSRSSISASCARCTWTATRSATSRPWSVSRSWTTATPATASRCQASGAAAGRGNVAPTPGAFDFDYRVHAAASGSASALARWDFTALVPGTYEVFATWPHHESRASDAPYTVVTQVAGPEGGFTEASSTVRINQKFAPGGALAGGRPWQSLGVYSTAGTTLRVELRNDADGLVAADAIRVVPVDPITGLPLTAKPGLEMLDLRGNPLDDASHDLVRSAAGGARRRGSRVRLPL